MPPSLFLILLSVFVDLLGYGIMLPLLPFYVQAQSGGAAIAGGLMSVYSAIQLVSGPALGAFSDRFGRKPILLICLFGTATSYLLLGLANSLLVIFIAVTIDGLTGSNLTLAHAYIADSTTPETRSRGMSLVGAAFGLGLMAGPALGGMLSGYGLGIPAFIAAGIAFTNVLLGLFFLPESLPPERRSVASVRQLFGGSNQLKHLFSRQNIQHFLIALFLLNLAFAGLQTNFPLFSNQRFGWTPAQNSYFYLYVGLCAVFIQGFLYGKLQPRFGERALSLFGLACMTLGLALMAFAGTAWQLLPAVAVVALGTGCSIPSLSALISIRVPESEQGRLMGGNQLLLSLTNIFGPALAGITFDLIAVYAPYWLGSLLALSALVVAYWGLSNSGQQTDNH